MTFGATHTQFMRSSAPATRCFASRVRASGWCSIMPAFGGVLTEHDTFSSRHGPANWMIFQDPPRHAQLRALVSRAFTPRSVANLERRIGAIARELLDRVVGRDTFDLAADFAVPLPMIVIAEMLGVPVEDRPRIARW